MEFEFEAARWSHVISEGWARHIDLILSDLHLRGIKPDAIVIRPMEKWAFARRLLPSVAFSCSAIGECGMFAIFEDGSRLLLNSNKITTMKPNEAAA